MKSKTILLVEDNADDVELALVALRECGTDNKAVVVRNGQEALDYLHDSQKSDAWPEVVLLDLQLPLIGGLEVLRRLRAEKSSRFLPVVILSSSGEARDVEESYRLGANSYIQKSLDFSKFSKSVELISRYWLELNQVPEICGFI